MAEQTEKMILKVARKHFVQSGYAATRMQKIADEAGINKAMLHYYFKSKEKLYQEIVTSILRSLLPVISEGMMSEGSFWDRLEKVVEAYISTLTQQPDIPLFIMYELSQNREKFVENLKNQAAIFPAIQAFIMSMNEEIQADRMIDIPPIQLLLSILGMTVFPFMSKPILCSAFNISDSDFRALMNQRKEHIILFMNNALRVK